MRDKHGNGAYCNLALARMIREYERSGMIRPGLLAVAKITNHHVLTASEFLAFMALTPVVVVGAAGWQN